MKTKTIIAGIGLFALLCNNTRAVFPVMSVTNIVIPDGSFEGVSASLTPPLFSLTTTTASIGAWTAGIFSLVSIGGDVQSGRATTLGGPAAADGAYDLNINLPLNVVPSVTLSQTLTNHFLPDSIYTLSVAMATTNSISLLDGVTLSFPNGNDPAFASLPGTQIVSFFTGTNQFQTVTLTYTTGNVAPTNPISIALTANGLATTSGDVFVDNFKLTVQPVQVLVKNVTSSGPGNLTVTGSGGAPLAKYEVIATTNLLQPTPTWAAASTNQFDTNGDFTASFQVDPKIPYRFFKVYVP